MENVQKAKTLKYRVHDQRSRDVRYLTLVTVVALRWRPAAHPFSRPTIDVGGGAVFVRSAKQVNKPYERWRRRGGLLGSSGGDCVPSVNRRRYFFSIRFCIRHILFDTPYAVARTRACRISAIIYRYSYCFFFFFDRRCYPFSYMWCALFIT